MEALAPQVVPIFSTPLGIVKVPGAEALNPAVAALLAEQATPARADPDNRQAFTYRSKDDLLQWTQEPVRKLTTGILDAVCSVARSINDFTDEQFAGLQVQSRAWYTIVRSDGCVSSQNYPNAAWCAVYCVAAPPTASSRYDSGVVRLHESFRTTMFADATNSSLRVPYRPGHSTWQPEAGQMVVFPASVTHEITLLRVSGELLLMTALVRFVAPGQTGVPWW
jgi:hypothetical protein